MVASDSLQPKHIKRFRMEFDLRNRDLPRPVLPDNYSWVAWNSACLLDHSRVKFESFQTSLDRQIFPALRTFQGCRELMQSIIDYPGFLAESTWLVSCDSGSLRRPFACATIQGLFTNATTGAIQNVGVVRAHRGIGLGRALVLKSLHGFRSVGLTRAYLDVSADNRGAINLYRSIGFQYTKTSYREVIWNEPETSTV